MALPVILVDSTDGAKSDTACSGAGPSTAVTDTAATSDGAGTTVTVNAGKNISGVATNGSAVLYFADTTAGHRRFTKITGSAGSGGATPAFTVSPALSAGVGPVAWAVGGVRATVMGSVSFLLFNNNTADGDLKPGWTVEMKSGHSESASNPKDIYGAGDTTSGPITLRGASGAATKPLLTFTSDDNGFIVRGGADRRVFRDFEMRNSNGSKSASTAFANLSKQVAFIGLKISHATDFFWKGLDLRGIKVVVRNCDIGYCTSMCITTENGDVRGLACVGNYIHDSGKYGVKFLATLFLGSTFYANVIANNVDVGLLMTAGGGGTNDNYCVIGNTFDSNGGADVEVAQADDGLGSALFLNNIFTDSSGYGLKFSNGSITQAYLDGNIVQVLNNNTGSGSGSGGVNTSGGYLPASYGLFDPATNPNFVGSGDYTPQDAADQAAFPTSIP